MPVMGDPALGNPAGGNGGGKGKFPGCGMPFGGKGGIGIPLPFAETYERCAKRKTWSTYVLQVLQEASQTAAVLRQVALDSISTSFRLRIFQPRTWKSKWWCTESSLTHASHASHPRRLQHGVRLTFGSVGGCDGVDDALRLLMTDLCKSARQPSIPQDRMV